MPRQPQKDKNDSDPFSCLGGISLAFNYAAYGKLHAPGVLHYVMVREIERWVIFLDDEDRSRFQDGE